MGGQGSQATNAINGSPGYSNLFNAPQYTGGTEMQNILSNYASGKSSLADALSAAKGQDPTALQKQTSDAYSNMWKARDTYGGNSQQYQDANQAWQNDQNSMYQAQNRANAGTDMQNAIFTSPLTGTQAATDQVMSNSLYQPYIQYGKDLIGQNDTVTGNLASDRQALSGNDPSYGLTNQDLQAYGQASDMAARMFGQTNSNLAQSLADRGLGSAPSGAAVQAFSGALGNQNEQLQQAQLQIAQNRVNTAQQLAQARTQADLTQQSTLQRGIQGMGQLAGSAIQDQFNRNMQGVNAYNQQNQNSLGAAQAEQNQYNSGFGQQQATKGPSFGDIIGGIGGSALSGGVGAFTGGLGSSLGGGLGKSLGGINPFGGKSSG